MHAYDQSRLDAAGFRLLEDRGAIMPGYGALRAAAIRADVKLDAVTAFRVFGEGWKIFARHGAAGPFVDHALMS